MIKRSNFRRSKVTFFRRSKEWSGDWKSCFSGDWKFDKNLSLFFRRSKLFIAFFRRSKVFKALFRLLILWSNLCLLKRSQAPRVFESWNFLFIFYSRSLDQLIFAYCWRTILTSLDPIWKMQTLRRVLKNFRRSSTREGISCSHLELW